MAEKSAYNILSAIESSKQISFSRFIYSLGIRNVGSHLSKVIEKAFNGNIYNFINAPFEDLENIDEVGPIVAKTINEFWQDKTNVNIVESCLALGVKLNINLELLSERLMNKSIVFTGSLTQFTRDEAKSMAESHGGKVSTSVSKNTDFIVAGKGAGSKLEKANSIGIPVLTEQEFLNLIK